MKISEMQTLFEKIPVNSLNISGPACGPDCTSTEPVSESGGNTKLEHAEDIDFEKNHQTELCDTLCDNGLGV